MKKRDYVLESLRPIGQELTPVFSVTPIYSVTKRAARGVGDGAPELLTKKKARPRGLRLWSR